MKSCLSIIDVFQILNCWLLHSIYLIFIFFLNLLLLTEIMSNLVGFLTLKMMNVLFALYFLHFFLELSLFSQELTFALNCFGTSGSSCLGIFQRFFLLFNFLLDLTFLCIFCFLVGLPNLWQLHSLLFLELLNFRQFGQILFILSFFGLLFFAVFYFLVVALDVFLCRHSFLLSYCFNSFESGLLFVLLCIFLLVIFAKYYFWTHLALWKLRILMEGAKLKLRNIKVRWGYWLDVRIYFVAVAGQVWWLQKLVYRWLLELTYEIGFGIVKIRKMPLFFILKKFLPIASHFCSLRNFKFIKFIIEN